MRKLAKNPLLEFVAVMPSRNPSDHIGLVLVQLVEIAMPFDWWKRL